jgi:hypothetical protein
VTEVMWVWLFCEHEGYVSPKALRTGRLVSVGSRLNRMHLKALNGKLRDFTEDLASLDTLRSNAGRETTQQSGLAQPNAVSARGAVSQAVSAAAGWPTRITVPSLLRARVTGLLKGDVNTLRTPGMLESSLTAVKVTAGCVTVRFPESIAESRAPPSP